MLPDISQLSSVNPEDMAGLWASYHSALGLNKGGLLKPSSTPPAPTHRENSVSSNLPLMEPLLSSLLLRYHHWGKKVFPLHPSKAPIESQCVSHQSVRYSNRTVVTIRGHWGKIFIKPHRHCLDKMLVSLQKKY